MRKLNLLIVALSFIGLVSKAQDGNSELLTKYFSAIKTFDFDNSISIANQIQDEELKIELVKLSSIVFNAGQLYPIDTIIYQETDSRLTNLVANLSVGYYHLYYNPYSRLSFEYLYNAYALSKESGNREAEKYCLLSIIQVYGLEVFQSSGDVWKYIDEYYLLIDSDADRFHYMLNVAMTDLRNVFFKDSRISMEFFIEFDDLMNSFEQNHNFWPIYLVTKAIYFEAFDIRISETLLRDAVDLMNNEPYLRIFQFRAYMHLADIMRTNNDFYEAIEFTKKANQYRNRLDTARANYYFNKYLSRILFDSGNHKSAYEHLLVADTLLPQLDYKKHASELADLNRLYQTQEKELALLKEKEKVRVTQNWLILALTLIVFITTVYILIQKNTKKRQLLAVKEKDIQKQKVSNLLKEQELLAIDSLIEGQEKERKRIATDLHDDLGGLMAAVKMHFEALRSKETPKVHDLYKKTNALIDEAYSKVRTIAHAKNSGVLAEDGLLKSVNEMAKKISIDNDLNIDVHASGLSDRLENTLELGLFRIIQELTTNVIKHSEATHANIYLTNYGDSLNLIFEDNGKGFDVEAELKNQEGMGIKSVEKRIEFLNGRIDIDSTIEKGTTLIIDIPL